MKTHRFPLRSRRHGFSLMEVLLAVMIFGMAVVGLVEAVNNTGRTALVGRRERQVQARLDLFLLQATRDPEFATKVGQGSFQEEKVSEGDTTFITRIKRLELSNQDEQPVPDIFEVTVIARWKEGRDEQEREATTWMYPPLFAPRT